MKNVRIFYLKIFLFLVVKFSIYLNGRIFVMGRLHNMFSWRNRKHIKTVWLEKMTFLDLCTMFLSAKLYHMPCESLVKLRGVV